MVPAIKIVKISKGESRSKKRNGLLKEVVRPSQT